MIATLAGLGVGGAVGGVVGALVGMGIPEYGAKRYEGRVKEGGVLVSVHCESSEEVSRAKELLERGGGEDVASAGEKSVSSHTVGRDRDTLDSDRNVETYRTKVPRSETVETVRTEDEIIDADTGRRRIV